MQTNKKIFYKYDAERFYKRAGSDCAIVQGLRNLVGISRTLQLASNPSAVPPLPHTLLHEALHSKDKVDRQCNTLVETLNSSGALDNSLAVCDVSGSIESIHRRMNGNHVSAILPAVALSPKSRVHLGILPSSRSLPIPRSSGSTPPTVLSALQTSWFTLTGV
jgi:Domain of unknown function (DUF2828)